MKKVVLNALLNDPHGYVSKITVAQLVSILSELSEHYYNTGEELVTDEIYDILVGSNQYRENKFPPKYRSVRLRENGMVSKGTRATDEQIKKWCKKASIDYNDYNKCTQLEVDYPKLFKKVMDKKLGIRVAYKEATAEKIKMKTDKDLPNFGDNF